MTLKDLENRQYFTFANVNMAKVLYDDVKKLYPEAIYIGTDNIQFIAVTDSQKQMLLDSLKRRVQKKKEELQEAQMMEAEFAKRIKK